MIVCVRSAISRNSQCVCLWHAMQVRFCRWFVANLAINWNAIPPNAVVHFLIRRINIPPVRQRVCEPRVDVAIFERRARAHTACGSEHLEAKAVLIALAKQQLKWLFDRLIDVLTSLVGKRSNAPTNKPFAWPSYALALRCVARASQLHAGKLVLGKCVTSTPLQRAFGEAPLSVCEAVFVVLACGRRHAHLTCAQLVSY